MSTSPSKTLLTAAWAAILLASLPKIILQEVFQYPVSANLQAGIAALIALVGLGLAFGLPALRPLRSFFGLLLGLVGVEWLVYTQIARLPVYQAWLNNPSFNVSMLAQQSLRLMVTLVIIAALFVLHKKASAFFLVKGDTAAPVEPVKWLGAKPGERWSTFGRNFTFFISLGTLAFLVLAGRPPLDIVLRALPFLPAVLLAATLNAFNEEMTYKASFLSVLEGPAGRSQALLLMAVYFGIGHYYGVPYGIIGVLMAGFLGWLLGKSMLETRGLFWAWFIHFWQDVLIFSFMAIGSITPGG
jgi:hypothetical protein